MKPLVLIFAAAAGLAMTALSTRGATLIQNAICAASKDDLLLARDLMQEGDEKALQVLFQKGLIRNLNDVEITRISETFDEHGFVVIRVVGTVDFYYTAVRNIVKSKAEQVADAAQVAQAEQDEENAELAREARFNKARHALPTPPNPEDILLAAYKAFDKANSDLISAQQSDPEGALATTKQAKLNLDAAEAEVSKAQQDYLASPIK